jgi:hypothetical protein
VLPRESEAELASLLKMLQKLELRDSRWRPVTQEEEEPASMAVAREQAAPQASLREQQPRDDSGAEAEPELASAQLLREALL